MCKTGPNSFDQLCHYFILDSGHRENWAEHNVQFNSARNSLCPLQNTRITHILQPILVVVYINRSH